ncbi:nucleotide exchange factor GrpE [Candidatus Saccharibacteria bacterium]|nr:nucleotide exchange factor GrpE [Candidatus Saccharibacteria bacterium]
MNEDTPKKGSFMKKNPVAKKDQPTPEAEKIAELTADVQRIQADFENYKKRVAAERANLMDNAKLAVLTDLLPALDNFDRAANHLPEHLASDPWAQGMSYVGSQLEQILDEMGVKKFVPEVGTPFDFHRMDALEHVASDHPPETVAEVLTPGYEISGVIARPASVRISSGPEEKESIKQDNQEGDK